MTGLDSLGSERDGVPELGPAQHSIPSFWSPVFCWHLVQNQLSFSGTRSPFSKNPTEKVPRPGSHPTPTPGPSDSRPCRLWEHQCINAPSPWPLFSRKVLGEEGMASGLSAWPPSCSSHLTYHFHECPCSSSLTPHHCLGNLLTAPMDTTCSTRGSLGTQSAFQTGLSLMSLGSPSLCLPGTWLSLCLLPSGVFSSPWGCYATPVPSTLASFLLAIQMPPFG